MHAEIQVREKCPYCETGYFYSDEWMKWGEGYQTWVDENPESRVMMEYPVPMPSGSEEYPCPDCEGTTIIYRWIPVLDLLRILKEE